MNPWPDDDPEVQEVIEENGGRFRYRHGRWYGGVNPRTGRWDLRVAADPADAMQLTRRVYEKKMERQRRELEEQQRQQEAEAEAEARAEQVRGSGPRRAAAGALFAGAGVTALGAQAASIVAAAATVVTPVISQVLEVAARPLGATGQGSVQIGLSLLNFLTNSMRMASYAAGAVLSAALLPVLSALLTPAAGAAVSALVGVLTVAFGQLTGAIGQSLSQALSGLTAIFEDINRVGRETADLIMQIALNAGMGAEAATRLAMGLQAAGIPLQQVGQVFGRWEMRPEFLALRLGVLGVDYEQFMRAPALALHDALQRWPEFMRLPMLRAALGPQAAAWYPLLMRPREELEEAQRLAERWAGSPEALERMQRHVEAMQTRVAFLGRMLRLHLLEGFLPLMERGLETLLRLWDQNRERVLQFVQVTAPQVFLNAIERAVSWLQQHWDEILQGARDFRNIVRDIARDIGRVVEWLERIADLWPFGRGGGPSGPGTADQQPGPEAASAEAALRTGGHGPVYEAWESARALVHAGLWTTGGLLALRWLSGLPGLAGITQATAAVQEAPLAAGLIRLLTGLGRADVLMEAPHLLFAGPPIAGITGLLATVPGLAEQYSAGLQGRQPRDWSFLASMLGMAALGWRYAGPVGALIGLGVGAFAAPTAEWLGTRRRRATEEAETTGMELLVEAAQEDETLRRAWRLIPHAERGEWLRALAQAGTEQERERIFEALKERAEQAERWNRFSDAAREAMDAARQTIHELRENLRRPIQVKVEHKEEIEVRPAPNFYVELERRIIQREIQAQWREAQEAMS